MMKRLLLLSLLVVFAVPAQAHAAAPCRDRIFNDWYADGKIASTYPHACYVDALHHIPPDADVYSSLRRGHHRGDAGRRPSTPRARPCRPRSVTASRAQRARLGHADVDHPVGSPRSCRLRPRRRRRPELAKHERRRGGRCARAPAAALRCRSSCSGLWRSHSSPRARSAPASSTRAHGAAKRLSRARSAGR